MTSNRKTAIASSTITLTAAPEDGYQLSYLTVTGRNGKEITLKDRGDGTYTFTMPSSSVTVKAKFAPAVTEPLPFTDVPDGAYYYDAVGWAVANGITNGTSPTTFSPENYCTRAQMVTFLWRYSGSPEASGSSFTDVKADAYYATAVAWADREGITLGTSSTTFSPNTSCTRGQIVTFLYRAQ